MELQYLGTAAAEGYPALFCRCDQCEEARLRGGKNIRTRSQSIVDGRLLIDFPPDTYLHMLQGRVDLPRIRQLLVTHSHQDHFYALDLMQRCSAFANDLCDVLNVYGNEDVYAVFRAALRESPHYAETLRWVHFHLVEPFVPFTADGYRVTPLLATHQKGERCYVYEIEQDGRRLLYANDTGLFPKVTWDYISGHRYDLVSMDCTMITISDGTNHMGLADNRKMRAELERLHCADASTNYVLTHFSHNGGMLHEELEETAGKMGFQVAYDGFRITV